MSKHILVSLFLLAWTTELSQSFVLRSASQGQQQTSTRYVGELRTADDQFVENDDDGAGQVMRRTLLKGFVATFATKQATSLFVGIAPAHAAMENSQKVFEVGKGLTPAEAKARFKEGQASLKYLLDHYDEICAGGGDNVRRYLGTVGTTSGLYGISKVMRILQDEADDIVDYTETMNEVNAALQGADGSAYMAIFTVTSTTGIPPEKYFDDAKIDVKHAMRSMQDIANQLDIR